MATPGTAQDNAHAPLEGNFDTDDLDGSYQAGLIHKMPGVIRNLGFFVRDHKMLGFALFLALVFQITGLFISVHELTGTKWAFYVYNLCTLFFAYFYTKFRLFVHTQKFVHQYRVGGEELNESGTTWEV